MILVACHFTVFCVDCVTYEAIHCGLWLKEPLELCMANGIKCYYYLLMFKQGSDSKSEAVFLMHSSSYCHCDAVISFRLSSHGRHAVIVQLLSSHYINQKYQVKLS